MNETIELKTLDNHNFNAFISRPETKPKGGLVVIQEIFGVNEHIREVCKKFMKEGYLTIAPSLFCLLYTSPSPRDYAASRMPSSA